MKEHLNRRQAIASLGAAGMGLVLAACSGDDDTAVDSPSSTAPASTSEDTTTSSANPGTSTGLAERFDEAGSCQLTTELTEGPYYIDVDSIRRDIREDREGQLLRVGIRVQDDQCQPIPDAVVEIWHCDAVGIYSGFEAQSEGRGAETDDTRYLRGGQITDDDGIVEFVTVYPGWYRGRTIHIHSKVHVNSREVLTSQLFFDEEVTSEVFEQEPYASDTGRDTFNDNDGIFADSLIMTTTRENDAYLGLITYNVTRT